VCVPIRRPPVVVCMHVGNHVESRAADQSACKRWTVSSWAQEVCLSIWTLSHGHDISFDCEVLRIQMGNVRGPRAT
jgi:hypothetical protein